MEISSLEDAYINLSKLEDKIMEKNSAKPVEDEPSVEFVPPVSFLKQGKATFFG